MAQNDQNDQNVQNVKPDVFYVIELIVIRASVILPIIYGFSKTQAICAQGGVMRAFFLFLLLSSGVASAAELKFGYISALESPDVFVESGSLQGGFVKAIGDELGRRLGAKVSFVVTSRNRADEDLARNAFDCIWPHNPKWTAKRDDFLWAETFPKRNFLFVEKGKGASFQTLQDLNGKRVGTITGYSYPALANLFEQKTVLRDDATKLEFNMKKLLAGRIDGLIFEEHSFHHFLKKSEYKGRIEESHLLLEEVMQFVAISKQTKFEANRLQGILGDMRKDGAFETLKKTVLEKSL
jgi:polar amino acid transport system substrate-binding protein